MDMKVRGLQENSPSPLDKSDEPKSTTDLGGEQESPMLIEASNLKALVVGKTQHPDLFQMPSLELIHGK
jgi:hypothetical protein